MAIRLSSPCIRASEYWESWFRRSLDNPPEISWERGLKLTEAERKTIRSSVQEFPLGERSEGRHLKRAARDYAQRSGDVAYSHAVDLFIFARYRNLGGRGVVLWCNPLLRDEKTDELPLPVHSCGAGPAVFRR
jgi:hypothetical protein